MPPPPPTAQRGPRMAVNPCILTRAAPFFQPIFPPHRGRRAGSAELQQGPPPPHRPGARQAEWGTDLKEGWVSQTPRELPRGARLASRALPPFALPSSLAKVDQDFSWRCLGFLDPGPQLGLQLVRQRSRVCNVRGWRGCLYIEQQPQEGWLRFLPALLSGEPWSRSEIPPRLVFLRLQPQLSLCLQLLS